MRRLADGEQDSVRASLGNRPDDLRHVLDAGKKSGVVEKRVIDGNDQTPLRSGVEKALQPEFFHRIPPISNIFYFVLVVIVPLYCPKSTLV
ncbi:hypothetical protein [Amorphus suaedae]